jgi:catechol 2,3-dioxygenase-like lactoylglutathione lyase family enzyme
MSIQPRAILETALYVDDLVNAEAFYRDVIGLPFISHVEGRHAFFRCGQSVLLLFNPDATRLPPGNPAMPVPPHGAVGEGHVCFRATADELDGWQAHFEQNAIAIEADFRWPSGGRSIYVRDPSGNSVEFAEGKIWGLE